MTRLPPVDWLSDPATVAVMDALEAEGGAGCARFVGGCVRNTLMGVEVDDVDIATVLTPDLVVRAVEAAGLRAVPTGIDHGTVTVVSRHRGFEVTTLRRDVETDGRRAVIAFTDDWREDAERRDFRLNALYADRAGEVFDPVGGGVDDAEFGRIVFVGDAETRIREDYLRILRFFRFFAWYGRGDPDATGLEACARLKDGIGRLSAERISKELLKLLAAPDPRLAVRLMRDTGVLDQVLPGELRHDRFESLVELGEGDAVLRLSALLPDEPSEVAALAERLRLSNTQRDRLVGAAQSEPPVTLDITPQAARAAIYRLGAAAFDDRVRRAWAEAPEHSEAARALLALAGSWTLPKLPVGGAEAKAAGLEGPAVGRALKAVEDWWIAEDFPAGGALERLHAVARGDVA